LGAKESHPVICENTKTLRPLRLGGENGWRLNSYQKIKHGVPSATPSA